MRASSRGGGGKTPAPGMYPAGVRHSPTRFYSTYCSLLPLAHFPFGAPIPSLSSKPTYTTPSLIFHPCTGTSTPAGAAVLTLCTIHGHAGVLQPLHGHARPRHDANGHATPQHGPPKPIGGCSGAWVQQPPSVSTAAHRCCSRPQPKLSPNFTSVSHRRAFFLCLLRHT